MHVQEDPIGGVDLDLRHYLRVVARRRWIILGVGLVVGLAAMGYAFTKEDRYRASAEMLLLAPGEVEAQAQALSDDPERVVANEIEILGSLALSDAVEDAIGPGYPSVSAAGTGQNDIIILSAEDEDPEAAKVAVNAYAQAYERLRRQRTVQALNAELEGLQQDLQGKRQALNRTLAPLTRLDEQLATLPPGPERDQVQAERDQVASAVSGSNEGLLGQISQLESDIQNVQRARRNPSGGVDVLNPATTPNDPFFPQPKKDLAVGIVVGLLIGLAAAFVWEQLDDAVRGRADADRATGGLPVVGLVPRVPGWRNRAEPLLVTRDDPRSGAAESYRSLVTSLEFLGTANSGQVVLFTSPGASEGKTTTVANVGMAFAEAGHNTVIVDADLRRPRLHKFLDVPGEVGLSTVLVGKIDIATAVQTIDGEHPIHVVPAGPIAPNPAELLRTDVTETALTKLRDAYDVVLVDSPPVLPVADALVLSRHADITILLATADGTSRRKLSRAVESLRQVDAPLKGLVLNGVGEAEGYEYGYYGEDESGTPKKRRGGRRSRRKDKS